MKTCRSVSLKAHRFTDFDAQIASDPYRDYLQKI